MCPRSKGGRGRCWGWGSPPGTLGSREPLKHWDTQPRSCSLSPSASRSIQKDSAFTRAEAALELASSGCCFSGMRGELSSRMAAQSRDAAAPRSGSVPAAGAAQPRVSVRGRAAGITHLMGSVPSGWALVVPGSSRALCALCPVRLMREGGSQAGYPLSCCQSCHGHSWECSGIIPDLQQVHEQLGGLSLQGGVPPTAQLPGTLAGTSVPLQSPGKGFHPKPHSTPAKSLSRPELLPGVPSPLHPSSPRAGVPEPCASLPQSWTPWSWTSYRNGSGHSSPASHGAQRSSAMEPRPLNAAADRKSVV